jgi:hypothetical protein
MSAGLSRLPACTGCGGRVTAWEYDRRDAMGGRCKQCQGLFEEGKYCPVCVKVRLSGKSNLYGH